MLLLWIVIEVLTFSEQRKVLFTTYNMCVHRVFFAKPPKERLSTQQETGNCPERVTVKTLLSQHCVTGTAPRVGGKASWWKGASGEISL